MEIILVLVWSGWTIFFQVVDTRLKFNFLLSLSMNHACDVINLSINESVQKTFARRHFELIRKSSILLIFLTSIWLNANVICIRFHRTLWEGQEIDRRSKFFASCHLKSIGWFFSFSDSYHSTWSSWHVINPLDVYRLMSHVSWTITFFHPSLLLYEREKLGIKEGSDSSNWRIYCTDFKNIHFVTQRSSNRKLR